MILGCNTRMLADVGEDFATLDEPRHRNLVLRAARMGGEAFMVYTTRASVFLAPRWSVELIDRGGIGAVASEMFVARVLALMAREPEAVNTALTLFQMSLAAPENVGARILLAPKTSPLGQYLLATWAERVNEVNGRGRRRKHRKVVP